MHGNNSELHAVNYKSQYSLINVKNHACMYSLRAFRTIVTYQPGKELSTSDVCIRSGQKYFAKVKPKKTYYLEIHFLKIARKL